MSTAKRNVIVTYRLATAALAWVAIVAQLGRQVSSHNSVANFFSYFTIQSNLIGISVLAFGALVAAGAVQRPRSFAAWRGAATLYLTVTGIVYALLLSSLPDGPGDMQPWVDAVLHKVLPALVVLDWLYDRPHVHISRKTALLWLAYPLAYLAYSLIRGAIVKWYPYPFIDPSEGYVTVALTSTTITAAAALLALLVAAWPRSTRQKT